MTEFDLLVSAAFGMEAIVVRELRDLGYADAKVEDGRIRFRADAAAICRTNLWLRCAERVQVVVGDFRARNFDELFDQIKVLPWEEWLPVDAKFPVTARCVRSEINSVPNTQKMVKRAIVERMRKVYQRHWFVESGSDYNVDTSILGDRVLMTIDTTGDGLHRRGYRNLVGQAPLRETVAAALVKLSYWNRDRLLVDPFCGSGTIPIEAAMIGRNLAPGRNRNFIAENWEQIPAKVWSAARQEVKDLEDRRPLSIPIVATDRDRYAIKMATQHARQAGVATDIHFEKKDFVAFPTNRDYGILICNPPYGERMGSEAEIRQLYRDMGELLRPLDDWSLYILTGADGFEREFGKQADRRRKLYNARIPCTFYQYLGPKPSGSTSTGEPVEEQAVETVEPTRHQQPENSTSETVSQMPDQTSDSIPESPSRVWGTRRSESTSKPDEKTETFASSAESKAEGVSESKATPAEPTEPAPTFNPWANLTPRKSRSQGEERTRSKKETDVDQSASERSNEKEVSTPQSPEPRPASSIVPSDSTSATPSPEDKEQPQESVPEKESATLKNVKTEDDPQVPDESKSVDSASVEEEKSADSTESVVKEESRRTESSSKPPAKHPWKKNPWPQR